MGRPRPSHACNWDLNTMFKKHIIKSAGIIGFATVISRVLGFMRDIIIAKFFGTAKYAEAFVVAFRIPNMLRDLIGEGAANAAFVPVLSEYAVKKKEEFWELANVILNLLLITLSAITIAGVLASPLIVRLIAPGFLDDPEKFAITVRLTRLMSPYILLIGLTAYMMGVLNSLKHFSMPAFGPCLLNIAIIICAIIWGESVMGLASGVLIGGVLQLVGQGGDGVVDHLIQSAWTIELVGARIGHHGQSARIEPLKHR